MPRTEKTNQEIIIANNEIVWVLTSEMKYLGKTLGLQEETA